MTDKRTSGGAYALPAKEQDTEPKVTVYIPKAEDGADGVKVEQQEVVIINGTTYLVKRGEYVEVPVEVFIQLRNKYPNI